MKTLSAQRKTQLTLRFDNVAPDDPAAGGAWNAGGRLGYQGEQLTLVLDTACRSPQRQGDELHLPLPPAAAAQQIRDAAESWLRREALRVFATVIAQKSALAGRQLPAIKLSFGKHSDWVRPEGDHLRCHWRLIEQSPLIIEQVLGRALRLWQAAPAHSALADDLFALMG
jgi:hypothetical protein